MKAAILKEYGKFTWEEKEIGDPGPGEVQLKVTCGSICGTDMHIFHGDFHPRTPVPFVPGHEFAGVVEICGPGVNDYSGGEKVVVDPIIWCGKCKACKSGQYPACDSLKIIGIDMDGGFSQYINVNSDMLFRAGSQVKNEHLALTEIYGIGFHACARAGVQPGDTLTIWGAGRVGQVILQAARTITREPIFIVDIVDSRLNIAGSSCKDVITINALKEDPVAKIREHTGGKGTDIAFEAVGHALHPDRIITPVRGAIQSIRGGGRVCVLGLTAEPVPIVFQELIWKEATIISSRVSHGEYPTVIEQLEKGTLNPESLISLIMPANEIQEAFEKINMEPEKYLKIMLNFNDLK